MKGFIERQLRKVFGVSAHDPDTSRMTAAERRDAQSAMRGSGRDVRADFVDGSEAARALARAASETGELATPSPLVDGSESARLAAEVANEKDGSHLRSELVDDSEAAREEVLEASKLAEVPRSDLVDDSDDARAAAALASEQRESEAEKEERERK